MQRRVVLSLLLTISLVALAFGQYTAEARTAVAPAAVTAQQRAAAEVLSRFVRAINHGDGAAVASLFAPAAVFDSDGRIFRGRQAIMDDFLTPDVLQNKGKYTVLKRTYGPGPTATFEFNFMSTAGPEHFTYRAWVQGGRFVKVVGRTI